MPVISKDQAIDLLTTEVEKNLHPGDLLEVYNEVFPGNPYTEEKAYADKAPLVERLANHLHSGLEVEEIVDFWNLVFPKHRNVWYDEEEQQIHYNEESEPLHAE